MMKKLLTLALLGVATGGVAVAQQGIYQFKDPGFDSYTATSSSTEWHSFESATGAMKSFASSSPKPTFTDKGHDGTGKSAKITSKNLLLAYANGNLTTGTINMGSAKPADASNYNYTDRSGSGKCLFAGRPDAVSFYAYFTPGSKKGSHNGRGQFILHGDVDYKDPEDASQASYKVGSASVLIPNTNGKWLHFTGEFTYSQEQPAMQYLLASFTTNPTPGGSYDDNLWIDDVTFVYYHALSELKYDNQAVSGFAETTTSYDLSTQTYEASKLTYTVKGAGATAEESYDANTGVLTITVKGNDYSVNSSSVTTYTVQFAKPATEKVTTYSNDLLIDLRGTDDSPMGKVLQTGTPIKLIEKNGSYSFLLENFNFQGMTIGDIRVDNLTRTETANGAEYSGSGEVQVTGTSVNVTVNATVKGDSMTATIEIPGAMGAFNITVTFAPTVHIDGRTLPSVYAAEGRTIIELKRHFLQGWNSLILPIDVTTTDLATAGAEVKAQEFSAASEAGLSFTAATDLKAGTPYLVFFSADADLSQAENTKYFAVNKVDFNNNIVTHGAYSFVGNYEKDFSATGLYGVADFDGVQKLVRGGANATIQPTSAYFKSNDANAQGMRILFDGTVTGINGATTTTTTAPAAVYDLRGVKVSDGSLEGLASGIYVQGGKKILVK